MNVQLHVTFAMIVYGRFVLHSKQSFERLQSIWPEFIANEALVWSKFHHYWLAIASSVPVLFVRYEDLLNDEQVRKQSNSSCTKPNPCQ